MQKDLSARGVSSQISYVSSHRGSDTSSGEYAIFMIRLTDNYKSYLAQRSRFKAFYKNRSTTCRYLITDNRLYERFKPIDTIRLLKTLFAEEIDLEKYQKEGFILDHFPLHHHRKRKEASRIWNRHIVKLMFSCVFGRDSRKNFKGLISLNFYYGNSVGFFMAFIIVYSAWLAILMVP